MAPPGLIVKIPISVPFNNLQNYGDPEGITLRSALAEKHRVRIEEVVLGAGIDDLLALFCRAFADPGSAAITTLGTYPTFEYGAQGAGLEIHRVPYRNDAVDLEALIAKAWDVNARIVYLANPDNPSGSWQSITDVQEFKRRLPPDALLLLDEAYSDFAPAVADMDPSDASTVVLRTFSKGYGLAGLRVAYAIGTDSVVRRLDRIRMHFGVSIVAQRAALVSLNDPHHLANVVADTNESRERLARFVRTRGLKPLPSHTNFLTIDVGTKARADALLQDLLHRRVFVRKPGLPPLDRCIRITIGRLRDLDILEPILEEAIAALKG